MSKLTKLRDKFDEVGIDAILITSPFNREYMTQFTGTAGSALITKDKALLLTDFRYVTQASEQAKDFTIIQHKTTIEKEIANQIKTLHIKKLGFEGNNITYRTYTEYEKMFQTELIPIHQLIEELRIIKYESELKIIKQAAEIADAAFEHIVSFIKPGKKEIEVSNELEFFMRNQGATSSSFDTIVASGYRSALPHGVASDKVIEAGELVTLDYGALFNGYCSDITRTIAVGEVNERLREIYDVVLEAQKLGLAGTKPNISGREADKLTRDYITEKGYGEYFGHSTGHGLGMEVHESPRLAPKAEEVLKPGMVVTIEPGIYVPNVGGCRIEDDIVITKEGNERLTHAPKEFMQI